MLVLKSFVQLLLPGVLFCGACYLQFRAVLPSSALSLLQLFPVVAAVIALLLGWRFNRSRVIWILLLLVLAERCFVHLSPYGREYLGAVAPILLPLNLLMIGWWSERGLVTGHGIIRSAIVGAQVGGLAWFYRQRAGEFLAWAERPLMRLEGLPETPFAHWAMVAMIVSLIGLLVLFWKKPEALTGAFPWVLATTVVGLARPEEFAFWAGIVALILVVALVESSFTMAFNDELTGLPARRAMNEFLLKIGRRYTVAMVDVDHFKKVNDTYGHDVGDQVLRMVAGCLSRVAGGGRVFRYGGEEFAVIFPGKDVTQSLPYLEDLREQISQAGFALRGQNRPKKKPKKPAKKRGTKKLQVTASIGVAERSDKHPTSEAVIKAADQALYKAKKTGRNRVCH